MSRAGIVLVEVLLALAILGIAGLSMLGYVGAISDSQRRLVEAERELERAERVLSRAAALTHDELSQRLGVRTEDPFVVWTDRPEPSLFRIGVAPVSAPERELVATLLYRPPSNRGSER